MYWLDTVILIILAAAGIFGAIISPRWVSFLFSSAASTYVAVSFCGPLTPFVQTHMLQEGSPPFAAGFIAFLILFLATWLSLFALFRYLENRLKESKLSWVNWVIGALLLVINAGLVMGVVFYGMNQFSFLKENVTAESKVVPVLTAGVDVAYQLIPKQYQEQIEQTQTDAAGKAKSLQETVDTSMKLSQDVEKALKNLENLRDNANNSQ